MNLSRSNGIALAAALIALAATCLVFRPIGVGDLAREGRTATFVDRYGTTLGTLLDHQGRRHVPVRLGSIAPSFVRAIVAAEDARFFQHGAIDGLAAVRAFAQGARRGRIPGGASTIEMQLARLMRPVAGGWRGKLRETWLAARIELGSNKREILEAYVNRVPMGENVVGIEAAAQTYFGVPASALDLAESAFLAAIPNDPGGLDPYRHFAAARRRERYVLRRMVAAGAIDERQADLAADERLALRPRGGGIAAAPQFLFWLAPQAPVAAGPVVKTTLDAPLQRFVQAQARDVTRALAGHDAHQASVVVVDNDTGAILAYVGSADYFADDELGKNDGVRALRQPGSTLKPFLYELALETRAIRPTTILLDVPSAYAIPGGKLYAPSDYDGVFSGPVRVRIALADSLNVPAVRVLARVGTGAFLARLHELGFVKLDRPASYYGLGLTLGGGEVSLFELVRAYIALARGGDAIPLVGLLAAERTHPVRARDPSWALVTDMLADRHARAGAFGVDSILALPFPAAVKTGTSSDFRDTWTVGFTRDYTVGVWVGNFDGSPMRRIAGVSGAGPLWNRIMLHLAERDGEPGAFDSPRGFLRRAICRDTGLRPGPGCGATVEEWLDRGDRLAYDRPGSLRNRATSAPFAIRFPHDGDRFALLGRGDDPGERIDVDLAQHTRAPVQVAIDGREVLQKRGTYP
ncbi:MAG: penicillin-binding protein 1C, partial [Candidatus Baltobacteraceae bacterium]